MFGAKIEKGPKCWQIMQQRDGCAKAELSGSYSAPPEAGELAVLARAVMEESGEAATGWEPAATGGGKWSAELRLPAGGLYRIETCLNEDGQDVEWSRRGDMIHHVGVGDVYAIAGQSNSTGYGRDAIADPPEIGVHILRNSGRWDLASHPLGDSTDSIHPVNADLSNTAHSPYLHFAKCLKRALGYPIGLLQASLGGSPLSRWNPMEAGDLYENMIEIIAGAGGSVKGILWYQGCSETNSPDESSSYGRRFMEMAECLRRDLADAALPFITVQLNRWLQPSPLGNIDAFWGRVREAQRQAAKTGGIYVVPALDCRLSDSIHNSAPSNLAIGERMANAALAGIYGRKCRSLAPDISGAKKAGSNKIALAFDNVRGRLATYDLPGGQSPFTVDDGNAASPNRVIHFEPCAKNGIMLTLERDICGPCAVHGAYEQNPAVFLPYDTESYLPMLAFYQIPVQDGGESEGVGKGESNGKSGDEG
jgi:hypothetical protein